MHRRALPCGRARVNEDGSNYCEVRLQQASYDRQLSSVSSVTEVVARASATRSELVWCGASGDAAYRSRFRSLSRVNSSMDILGCASMVPKGIETETALPV